MFLLEVVNKAGREIFQVRVVNFVVWRSGRWDLDDLRSPDRTA
jgi:hypothetical protein